jgi:8-hydroxy-5-deazaflavin:NADPH oxidoreductase
MTNPKALSGPSTVFPLRRRPPAKQTVAGLLTDLGWRPMEYQLDLGGITTARGPEHLVPLLLGVYDALGTTAVSINIVR